MTNMLEKVNQVSGTSTNVRQLQLQHSAAGSFGKLLKEQAEQENGVRFSKHAAQRVQQRGIQMTETLLDSLNQAVGRAREKGAKDVVVISSQAAFIVNVANNTVITSMTGAEMRDNIFTNIDSAVVV